MSISKPRGALPALAKRMVSHTTWRHFQLTLWFNPLLLSFFR